jgi:hypothetical protein
MKNHARFLFLSVWLLAQASAVLAQGEGAQGCAGFVRASEIGKKSDLSNVQVKLFAHSTGLLKYSTECAPNGYFYVPAYDQGTFVLRVSGPDGWAFEPSEVKVKKLFFFFFFY